MVFDDGGLKPVSGPIVCFEAAASDDHGDHAPIVIKKTCPPTASKGGADGGTLKPSSRQQTSGAFPPNTLFRLKETKPAGS